jgi:hypothetical protein
MNTRFALITFLDGGQVDPGFGVPGLPGYGGRPDNSLPGYGHPDHGLPGSPGHPGNALPVPPVKPSNPITLPPGVWPPRLPPEVDNALPPLPPEASHKPIQLPADPDLGISQPIVLPPLPPGVAILIALPYAQPKAGTPPGTVPAILLLPGKRPVLVYVSAAATPK